MLKIYTLGANAQNVITHQGDSGPNATLEGVIDDLLNHMWEVPAGESRGFIITKESGELAATLAPVGHYNPTCGVVEVYRADRRLSVYRVRVEYQLDEKGKWLRTKVIPVG